MKNPHFRYTGYPPAPPPGAQSKPPTETYYANLASQTTTAAAAAVMIDPSAAAAAVVSPATGATATAHPMHPSALFNNGLLVGGSSSGGAGQPMDATPAGTPTGHVATGFADQNSAELLTNGFAGEDFCFTTV